MLPPATTVAAPAVFVTARSARSAVTVVVAVTLLLPGVGSAVADATVAVLVMTVPPAVAAPTFTTSVNEALAPLASEGLVEVTVPVPPTAGVVDVHPAGAVNETNVVPAGTA